MARPELHTAPTVVRHDVSSAGLNQRVGQANGVHLGLTEAEFSVQVGVRVSATQSQSGSCAALEQVIATIGYQEMLVYVASNYDEGTCEYNAILNHEQTHVAFNNEVLSEYANNLQVALARIVEKLPSMSDGNPNRAAQRLSRQIQAKLGGTVSALERDRSRRNGMIDTREAYERTASLCTGWQ